MAKHKPPSRVRYEKSHPTISFRLDLQTKQRLEKVLEEKESVAEFIKEAIGVREREKQSLEYQYKKGSTEGYNIGYEDAKSDYGVYTRCTICGGRVFIDREEEKKDIDMFLRKKRLCHTACIRAREKMERRGWY